MLARMKAGDSSFEQIAEDNSGSDNGQETTRLACRIFAGLYASCFAQQSVFACEFSDISQKGGMSKVKYTKLWLDRSCQQQQAGFLLASLQVQPMPHSFFNIIKSKGRRMLFACNPHSLHALACLTCAWLLFYNCGLTQDK